MKLLSFVINMVYWMYAFRLLKHSENATEKVAFFLSLTVYTHNHILTNLVIPNLFFFAVIDYYFVITEIYV